MMVKNNIVLAIALAAGVSAQTGKPAQQAAPAAKKATPAVSQRLAPKTPVSAQKSATQKPQAKAAQSSVAKPAQQKVASPFARKPLVKKKTAPAKPVSVETMPASVASSAPPEAAPAPKPEMQTNRRDPFVSPIVAVNSTGPAANCNAGKRCLVIDQVTLRGIVKSPGGMLAVVENAAKRTYFLKVNDPVYNGFVSRITTDSVVFTETMTDRLGKQSQREITRRVEVSPV